MSWIIQIGLFGLLSLRRLIYAWVPKGRLQLSFLCLNLRLPVLGNKPAMIINHRQDLLNLKSKSYQINCSPVYIHTVSYTHLCAHACVCVLITVWPVAPEVYLLFFIHFSVLARSTALIYSAPLTAIESLLCQNVFEHVFPLVVFSYVLFLVSLLLYLTGTLHVNNISENMKVSQKG